MKARDLAALAALGIAGKMAYDKFGRKKDDEPKSKGKLGEAQSANDGDAGESEARMSKRDMNEGSGRRDAGGDADYQMPRTAPRTVPEDYDAPRTAPRQPVAVAKPVRTPVVTRSATPAADAVADDYVMPRTAPKPVMPDASRVTPYNSDIMYNEMVPADTRPAMGSMNDQAYKRNQRAGVVPSQMPNDAAQARILRQGVRQVQTPNAQAQARMMRQGSPMAASRANAGRPGYDEAGNPIAMRGMAGQRGFDEAGNPMKRGGMVKKMASGGMTSSKPSGASRGDGIAQRGRTRGKYL
jgi:hypothetical protein